MSRITMRVTAWLTSPDSLAPLLRGNEEPARAANSLHFRDDETDMTTAGWCKVGVATVTVEVSQVWVKAAAAWAHKALDEKVADISRQASDAIARCENIRSELLLIGGPK